MEAIDYNHRYHRIDIGRFHRMIEAGVFGDEDRVELIEGEMLDMSPIGAVHIGLTAELNMLFATHLTERAIVTAQGAVVLDDRTEVYPDLLILAPRPDFYRSAKPRPADVALLIEVSDSSLKHDLHTKVPIYARTQVPRVWIFDLPGRRIHTFADPDPTNASYRTTRVLSDGILSITLQDIRIDLDVTDLLRT